MLWHPSNCSTKMALSYALAGEMCENFKRTPKKPRRELWRSPSDIFSGSSCVNTIYKAHFFQVLLCLFTFSSNSLPDHHARLICQQAACL